MKSVAIIPAFNESKTIVSVLVKLKEFVDDIVVVDDGSTDGTGDIAKDLAIVVRNETNLGYDKSLDVGFIKAYELDADIFITLDADGQHNPDDVKIFLDCIWQGQADIVVGVRPKKQRIAEVVFAFYTKQTIGISDPLCGMKAYTKKVYDKVGFFDKIGSTGTQLMYAGAKRGFKTKEFLIQVDDRLDVSRFGGSFKGNLKIFKSLVKLIFFSDA